MSSDADHASGRDSGVGEAMGEKRHLLNLAYRLLGSLAEAEDAVQETYTRWFALSQPERDAIASPGAWLTTVAGRICLDVLGSARARRERYVGEWLPEPLPERAERTAGTVAPDDWVTLDESVSMAFLVVLESMTPAERVAFVLHDVFGYPFPEVAEIVGRSPGACRQLASSARSRLHAAPEPAGATAGQAEVVRELKRAWEARNIGALISLLDPDATMTSDGGGLVTALRRPLRGAEPIARFLTDLATRSSSHATVLERTVNGQPGLVAYEDGVVVTVFAFEVAADRIVQIWAMRNPSKLRPWAQEMGGGSSRA